MSTHTPDGARVRPIARPEAFGAWRSCAVARRWILWRSALVAVAAVDA